MTKKELWFLDSGTTTSTTYYNRKAVPRVQGRAKNCTNKVLQCIGMVVYNNIHFIVLYFMDFFGI